VESSSFYQLSTHVAYLGIDEMKFVSHQQEVNVPKGVFFHAFGTKLIPQFIQDWTFFDYL